MAPPELPGFEHVRLIGSGGYADVFLYNQQMPRRQVAIKVLTTEATDTLGRRQFFDEANAMASVSTHPFIVSVFHADVSAEGHPYLVMEYYPRDNFMVRARTEQIPVFEALRVGIQVASAVETAHRAGILHRDIKPANILTSEYDRPGLTDFGIATAMAGGQEAEGMSVPWSPPEVINGSAPGDVTADVYSLAATVHTLLSGRSPFEVPGQSNRTFDLMARIETGGPQPTGRPDVPDSVERILRHGMARQPQDRPPSAVAFARILQAAEVELGFAPTQLEIRQDPRDVRTRGVEDEEDGTRLKGPTIIQSQSDTGTLTNRSGGSPHDTRTNSNRMVRGVPGSTRGFEEPSAGMVEGGTVARGQMGPEQNLGIVRGVGALPPSLAGSTRSAGPQQAGVGGYAADQRTGDDQGSGVFGPGPEDSKGGSLAKFDTAAAWKLAIGVVLGVLVLVVIGVGFSKFGGTECEAGSPDCDAPVVGSHDAKPGVIDIPIPDIDLKSATKSGPGRVTLTWQHQGADPRDYRYRVLDQEHSVVKEFAGADIPPPVEGLMTVTVDSNQKCFTVRAVRDGRNKESGVACP